MQKLLEWGRYLLLCIFLLILYFLYGNAVFVVLFVMMTGLIPLSYIWGRETCRLLSISFSNQSVQGKTGDEIQVGLLAYNQTIFPILDNQISYTISSSFYPSSREYQVTCPIKTKSKEIVYAPKLHFENCGCYRIQLKKIVVCDILHLFRFEKDLSDQSMELLIFPEPVFVSHEESAMHKEGFEEYESHNGKGNVSSNVTDVREYIPGDRLQKIHWKMSARIGKWMVKENESLSSHRFTVLVELYKEEEDFLEPALSFLYGLSLECIRNQVEFDVMLYQKQVGEFLVYPVRTEESLEEMMIGCFYQKTSEVKDEALDILTRSGQYHGELAYVTGGGVSIVELE